jgi:hypothetical protein
MVHALELTHRLLNPNGQLISVHDLPTPHVIEIHSDASINKIGWLTDKEDFENTRAALNALAQVTSEGYFLLDDQQDFSYHIYSDGLQEFQEWLAEWWESAILAGKIIQQLETQIKVVGHLAKIVLNLQARMIKLKVV